MESPETESGLAEKIEKTEARNGQCFQRKMEGEEQPGFKSSHNLVGNATSFQVAFGGMRKDWDNGIEDSQTPDREAEKSVKDVIPLGG